MWRCPDNQDVGLEAATIERVRNSSLVEWRCAENVTGLSVVPKLRKCRKALGRGASPAGRSGSVSDRGLQASENAGMSSEKNGENPFHRKPKVS